MTLQLKQVEPRRLYQQIADQIRELIQQGGFDTGTRLPPERDLAQQLGVSRPSLREALIALDVEGSVEIRSGSGVYVCPRAERAPETTAALGESPSELMQARAAFEGSVIMLACVHGTEPALLRLREIVKGMRSEVAKRRTPIDQDRQFHLTIAEMSGNSVMVRIVAELFDERHSPISAKISSRYENARTWNLALKEHEAILRAIEARDPLAAQSAMHMHLKLSEERWVGADGGA
ncbi:FadR/GntR family transcriptional regulator [Rhizobacter sp. OV335]|nr:GntR family transcriptional regulator, transcriptional repressor for pyruvate dehydrogenase complex [Rhizobacter sp. OV335]